MEDNLYASPQAPLAVEHTETPFYVVSRRKFMIMYLGTAGLYNIYWFYRHWRAWQAFSGERMVPVLRAIFSIFFVHKLFALANQHAVEKDAPGFAHRQAATAFVVLSVLSYVMDRLAYNSVGSPFTDLVSMATIVMFYWLMVPAQVAMNAACADSDGAANQSITGANVAWLVVGALLWLLYAVGLLSEIFPEAFIQGQ